jgi:hypothetical protein
MNNTYETSPMKCLHCDKVMDRATGHNNDEAPQPGAIAICAYCGHIMMFDNNLSFREITDAEAVDIAGDPTVLSAMSEIARFRVFKRFYEAHQNLKKESY